MPESSLARVPPHQQIPAGKPGPQILAEERAKASFNPKDLARFLHGEEHLKRVQKILPILENEPTLNKQQVFYLSRTDTFKHGLRKEKTLFRLNREHKWTPEEATVAEYLLDQPAAFGLHKSMFMTTLEIATTDEQKKLFLEPAQRYEIIGCYSQTELGHGSNLQGLETTATYNPSTKSFIINSPTLTAAKWWSGGLGRSANHSIVMAQLFTPDGPNGTLVNRGPHTFIVPIRDLVTHEQLPGIVIGDIGPKFGYNMTDNGTMLLDNISIPHVNFLAKYAKVDINTGKFTPPASAKLSYGTMTATRAQIIRVASSFMARAAMVAIRYCSIRHQFADKDAVAVNGVQPEETAVINYQIVQARIFPALVSSFAFHFAQKDFTKMFLESEAAGARGDYSLAADVHASASGLKSICTIMTAQGIEDCRRACGGHGFSHASGLAHMYGEYVGAVTWEGDSYMLTQQVGRYLFKTYRALKENPKTVISPWNKTSVYLKKYLQNPNARGFFAGASAFQNPDLFVDAFGYRAAFLIAETVHKRDKENASWNALLVDIYRCSVAHSQFLLVLNFSDAIKSDPELLANKSLHAVMKTCFEYFAIYLLDTEATEFLYSGYISRDQLKIIRSRLRELLAEIRPNAVALVDGWTISDLELNSVLGRYDGDVYPNIYKFAQQEPLNQLVFNVNVRESELVRPARKAVGSKL